MPGEERCPSVEATIRFAIDLIKNHGHARNEVCHEHEGENGYCVGMATIIGSQAAGLPYAESRRLLGCYGLPWTDRGGVGGVLVGLKEWREARAWIAWAYGFPRTEDPWEWADDACVTPNQYLAEMGIDPVPYLENAIALSKGQPMPHDLPPVECWPRCSEGCGAVIRDWSGPCEACAAQLGFGRQGGVA